MISGKKYIVKLLVLLFAVLITDGGHSYYILHNQLHPVLIHKHSCDLEVPGHDRYEKLTDEDNLIASEDQEVISDCSTRDYNSCMPRYNSQDFSKSVWQPPRFI